MMPGMATGETLPLDGTYEASDRAFELHVTTDKLWIDFCRAAGLDEIAADPRFVTTHARARHREQLDELMKHVFAEEPAEIWLRFCAEAGVPAGLAG
jgi:crotonobetainyl-CoA:carnitine CoA-transferase CaiB-like acyl-CoA transferase